MNERGKDRSERVLSKLRLIEDEAMQELTAVLNKHSFDTISLLASVTATICGVDKKAMFSRGKKSYNSQARCFFWCAVKCATHETNESIARKTEQQLGFKCHFVSVGAGINRMMRLIDTDATWNGRWKMIKHIIRKSGGVDEPAAEKQKVTIIAPKDVEIEIKRK